MSMDRCAECERPIDTDEDTDCYRKADNPKMYWGEDGDYRCDNVCLCEGCRDQMGVHDE